MAKAIMTAGTLVISLDFELMWGLLDHKNPMYFKENVEGVYRVIPQMLNLFEKHGIHATWDIVGMMTFGSIQECRDSQPELLPEYEDPNLSVYSHFDELIHYDQKHLFAGELIRKILSTRNQEIGSQTYSHYYCMENGQTSATFHADLEKAQAALGKFNCKAKSLVLPRNQYNPAYAHILKENGFVNYRGNEKGWFNSAANTKHTTMFIRRACRLLDQYINISGNHCYPYSGIKDENGLNNIRSSRFFRPYSKALSFLEPLKLRRIKKQMEYAARTYSVFHMWWHPYNFGINTEKNIENLMKVLECYDGLKDKYQMMSLNMGELGDLIG